MMTRDELIAFEREMAELFNAGRIRAPVHLDGGNEDALIEIFREVQPEDWVCGSWRQHYHCLLKGVPPERLKAEILAGRSIALCFPEYRVVSSAIVGGVVPIALGLAWEIKRRGGTETVWCFVGDMTAETGIFDECTKYGNNHRLRMRWVAENNGKSVCTDTDAVWGIGKGMEAWRLPKISEYCYTLPWPHAGAGKRVQF